MYAKGPVGWSAQPIEFLQRHIELLKDCEEQRRANFPSTMQWDSRAVALGMHDFGRVLRQRLPAVLMLLGDQRKYVLEFSQGRLARVVPRQQAAHQLERHFCLEDSFARSLSIPPRPTRAIIR